MTQSWLTGLGFFLLFCSPALLLWFLSWKTASHYLAMRTWPRAAGIVQEARTVPMTRGSVRIEVRAAFETAGQAMDVWCGSRGRTGCANKEIAGQRTVRDLMESRFAAGKPVKAIFSPQDPTGAYFQMPALTVTLAMLADRAIWLAVGILWLLS
ncbi:MAG: DUF3592 domain-containing protein [Hyphomicrobiaceae bacterium]